MKNKELQEEELIVEKKLPVIALVGMPNSGKTTLFNALTGANYKTSNYPGSTVEYSSGQLSEKYNSEAEILDTPGIISLNPSSIDEQIAIEGLFNHPKFGTPDAVIVTCDVTQLSRQLFLVKQIVDSGFRTVVALTMNDILQRKDLSVNSEILENIIGCPVVKINASEKTGLNELIQAVVSEFNRKPEQYVHKPLIPAEDEISRIYDFTEETEIEVLEPFKNKRDIDELNRKLFGNLHREPDRNSLKIDKYVLHPVLGTLIFIISMGLIFTSIFWIAQPLMDIVDNFFSLVAETVSNYLPENKWYSDLISEGIITGLGAVMIFVPQIMILFILLGLLEDTGYLARAAMLIDKPLSKLGLNGRSFIPMLSGYACAIPAIMAARTISNRRERLLTIMIIPLMSCSARLPVYALLLAYLTPPGNPWIPGLALGALYLLSLIISSLVAGIISKFRRNTEKSTFMLELPPYRLPVLKNILKSAYYKAGLYIKQAGPVIIIISIVLWALTYFPETRPQLSGNNQNDEIAIESSRLNNSYAAMIGKTVLEPILRPLGWDWRVGVALISAFAAREVFVSAMAITFSITENTEDEENFQSSILQSMKEAKNSEGTPLFTTASVISLIIYFMFAMQCLSTVAVSRKETASWKIPLFQILLYSFLAYVSALLVYNGLKFIGIN
ncbi:MAG: ferrous iron transport protein B [Ignavibacteria bacterium]|nr:ferrous iron transport protein B [Ignavibacteria bacterium]